jgi:hypothetical protein
MKQGFLVLFVGFLWSQKFRGSWKIRSKIFLSKTLETHPKVERKNAKRKTKKTNPLLLALPENPIRSYLIGNPCISANYLTPILIIPFFTSPLKF